MVGLRERRHAETRAAISEAAFALFDEVGFADSTMEEIASRAGVSRSTAYRRFARKEDIVLDVPRRWMSKWDEAIEQLDDTATLAEAMAIGCRAVAAEIDNSTELVLAAYRALNESPALQASSAATSDWLERMVELAVARAPELDRFEAMTIAGAHLGAIDTMMMGWAINGGTTSVLKATRKVLDRLAPILPD